MSSYTAAYVDVSIVQNVPPAGKAQQAASRQCISTSSTWSGKGQESAKKTERRQLIDGQVSMVMSSLTAADADAEFADASFV